MAPSKPRVLYWFRTDLRLHDSPALAAALDLKPECLWPIWCWDPHYAYAARGGANRFQYLLDCMTDVSEHITRINQRSKLHVLREAPQTLLPKLFKAWQVTHLVFESDSDSYARERDSEVARLARDAGVELISRVGRTLWDPDAIVKANGGRPTMSLSQLQAAGGKVGAIPRPIAAPEKLPDPGDMPLDFDQDQPAAPDHDVNGAQRRDADATYDSIAGPHGDFGVPTLQEMSMHAATTPHRGGESRALASLEELLADTRYIATFEKPKTAPTAFSPQATTLLSPHLHFGSLSVREFYWRVRDVADGYGGTASQPPTSLEGQLLFREMYFGAQAALGGKFRQTAGNAQVRFVPWRLRSVVDGASGLSTGRWAADDGEAEAWLRRWVAGRTGFPWIDAAMRQLVAEGWIHHLARHAVACFLTRGGCYIDWERGAEVFERHLLDHEPACNAGNWQWLSCTAFFAQFYRCYSPVAFPKKWDPDGDYVRRYVPELAKFPKKYIYEPWKAPIKDQKDAGCRVTGDGDVQESDGLKVYPRPMFDFDERRRVCIDAMKTAYDVGFYGNSPEVRDGSWEKAFPDGAEGKTKGKSTGEEHSEQDVETDFGSDADDAEQERKGGSKSKTRPRAEDGGEQDDDEEMGSASDAEEDDEDDDAGEKDETDEDDRKGTKRKRNLTQSAKSRKAQK